MAIGKGQMGSLCVAPIQGLTRGDHLAKTTCLTHAFHKGTNWVSTNGVTASFMLFDRRTFWVLLLTYLYLPKSARAYLFPQSVKINYFC